MKKILIILISLYLTGCKTTKVIRTGIQKDSITTIIKKQIVRDTIYEIKKDSATLNALIKCINKKPVLIIDTVQVIKSKTLKPKIKLEGNNLTLTCKKEAEKLFKQWKHEYEETNTKTKEVITLEPEYIEKKLSWWQKLFINLGKLALAYIVFRIGKPFVLRRLNL